MGMGKSIHTTATIPIITILLMNVDGKADKQIRLSFCVTGDDDEDEDQHSIESCTVIISSSCSHSLDHTSLHI
jgi:hypothetical protein